MINNDCVQTQKYLQIAIAILEKKNRYFALGTHSEKNNLQ